MTNPNIQTEGRVGTWTVFRNSRLHVPLRIYKWAIHNSDYDAVLTNGLSAPRSKARRALQRALWFWPRIDEARAWAGAGRGLPYDPAHYLHTHRTRLVEKINEIVPKNAKLVELGCNCGSDMHILRQDGYTQITGVDASGAALEIFKREYPDTYAAANPEHDLFQRYLLNMDSASCDFIYSNGATIELVHPSFPIVAEICRVAKKGVLLDLSERHQGYPRDYNAQFGKHGFARIFDDKTEGVSEASSLIVFMRRSWVNRSGFSSAS